MEKQPIRILVVTDGRAGNEAQALGVAEALARRVTAEIRRVTVALRPALEKAPQGLLARMPLEWILADDAPEAAPGDLVISAGRRGALAGAALRRRGARAVAILDPQMSVSRFDAVIAPAHDRLTGANVIETVGAPNRLTPAVIRDAAAALAPDWRPEGPALAVMIGGPSRSARFEAPAMERLCDDLARFATAGWTILAVASRRTPDWAGPMLHARFPEAMLWTGGDANPYPGVLGASRAAMVTEDSVNMASEAATAGLPVFVSGLGRIDPKLRRFHEALAARGCARPAAEGPELWTYPPLAEADRVAALLVDRLALPGAIVAPGA